MFRKKLAKPLRVTFGLIIVVLLLWHGGSGFAAESRIALVIGNSGYEIAPLANPVNDAKLMAETLRGLGFEVIEIIDADRKTIQLATFELQDRLLEAGKDAVGLFYYAGHGVQVGGQNYLIPLNAEIEKEREVAIEAVSAGFVLKQMEFAGNRMNFVILDACRNNPLTRNFRSAARGLARMQAPTGSLVAYSTGPGEVAADGTGANSPYALALSQAMQVPGLPAELMFKRVRERVLEATNDEQTPWEESSLKGGDFYFTAAELVTVEAPATPSTGSGDLQTDGEATERLFWQSIKDTTDPEMFEAYLEQYPAGTFAALARLRIKQVENKQVAAEAQRLAAEEESRSLVEAQVLRLAAEEEARRLAEAEAKRLAAEEEARSREAERQALETAQQQAREHALWDTLKDSNRAIDYRIYLQQFPDGIYAALARARLAEAERRVAEEAQRKAQVAVQDEQETQTALLAVPTVSSIVVDKAAVENDDQLKAVIKKYFDNQKFMNQAHRPLDLIFFEDLSVKSISGTTFIADIAYRSTEGSINYSERAKVEIEKTANSYKIISFDRKR